MSPVWANWAGDQRCAPRVIAAPADEAELIAAVRRAAAEGRGARAAGSGHSFTDIACTDGTMLDLSRLDRIVEVDSSGGRARVQAGVSLHELSPRLADHGLALENLGDIDAQSIAGAVSTGTHGTGVRFGNISTQLESLRLVTAAGEAVECSMEDDPDLFLAARVGLGALGVISEMTLRCEPLFSIRRVDEPRPLDAVLRSLDELADGNDHFEFYVFPYTDVAIVRLSERGRFEARPPSRIRVALQDRLLENAVIGAAARVGRAFPRAIPALNRGIARIVRREVRTDRSYEIYASRREVRFTEMEYAIPRAAAEEAVRRVLDLVTERELPVAFPIEVRFVSGDDALLSPAHGRDTCYIAVHQFLGLDFETYFRAVEAIMGDYDGRPHWGKRHYRTAADLAPAYPEWERFRAVRERMDPDGVFANGYTRRVLG